MSKNEKGKTIISIIIPVYNVYKWLDQCIDSVVNQSFTEFEVILIDDGSTDGSGTKCDEWANKDKRIKVYHKKNEGLSLTRNYGLQKSIGEYFSFLDADDWLDHTYLEKMYHKAQTSGADLVECDIWRFNDIDSTQIYSPCYGALKKSYSKEEHMIYGNVALWKLLIRKKYWFENKFKFDDCHSPATPLYALLIAKANKIENVKEALYYYRRFRSGSLTMNPKLDKEKEVIGIRAFEYLLKNFHECGIDDVYGQYLERIIKHKMADLLAAFFYRTDTENYRLLFQNYYDFIKEQFPKEKEIKYLTWGGYNLTRILWHANYLHNPYGRFNFSSIISLMHPIGEQLNVSHKVKYREMMLQREFENRFWNILHEINPDFLIMDFIEERFDIIEYQKGFITQSDAFEGAEIELAKSSIIHRDSEQCRQLWEKSVEKFIKRLEKEQPNIEIILVKNYLSEKVGDVLGQAEFENISEIQKMNCILKEYYCFFEKHCHRIKVVESSKCNYYFTDKQYEYGTIPSHLNEIVNQDIAEMIERSIGA